MNTSNPKENPIERTWKYLSTIVIFCLLMLTLIIGSGEMLQGQLLKIGEQLFGDKANGVQYSYLRADMPAPTCNPNPDVEALVDKQMIASQADEFAALFGGPNRDELRQSVLAAQQVCVEKVELYTKVQDYITPGVKAYRTIETGLLWITRLGVNWQQVLLLTILFISAITTTIKTHHIGLRPAHTTRDFIVYNSSMSIANTLLAISNGIYFFNLYNSNLSTELSKLLFHGLWALMFTVLAVISLYKFAFQKQSEEQGTWGMALLSIPLYATLGIICTLIFMFGMDYASGVGIWLGQIEEFSSIFLKLALFIWIGMLLKQTAVVDYFMDMLRPFNLSPETLSVILMIAGAVMTAYTGASGVFVIAAGAIIYREVYGSGARRQYALAMTAMSGSLGVVLRPCLVIVVIAALNNQVTTDELYSKGLLVFAVSGSLLFLTSLMLADRKFEVRSPADALPEIAYALRYVAPYIIVAFAIILFFDKALGSKLNEFTASTILPFVLLVVLFYDKYVRGLSFRDTIEKITPYIAMPILVSGLYGIFMKIFGLESPLSWNLDLGFVDFTFDLVYVVLAILGIAMYQFAINTYHDRDDLVVTHESHASDVVSGEPVRSGFVASTAAATHETIGHIGALVVLMALSIVTGGLIERSEIMLSMPTEFSSTLVALALFTFVLVLIGMIMEPFGAAILVNATIAPIAYANGIHPVHFWMVVLTAFELGYLTPPVALNQLLARQVVGEDEMREADAEVAHKSFYWRYERWILPFMIMFTTLIIVSFAPYLLQMFGWY